MTQETQTEGTTRQNNDNGIIMIHMPPELKGALREASDRQDLSLASYCREVLAKAVGYEGPLKKETARTRKYASEEERKEAYKEKEKARRDVIKQLLEKYGDEVGLSEKLEAAAEKGVAKARSAGTVDDSEEDEDD